MYLIFLLIKCKLCTGLFSPHVIFALLHLQFCSILNSPGFILASWQWWWEKRKIKISLYTIFKSYRKLALVSKRTNKQMIINKLTNLWLHWKRIENSYDPHVSIKFIDSAKNYLIIINPCDYCLKMYGSYRCTVNIQISKKLHNCKLCTFFSF